MKVFFIFLASLLFFSNARVYSQTRNTQPSKETDACGSLRYAHAINFCIYNIESKNPDIIYYFHQAGGSEKSWIQKKQTFEFYRALKSKNKSKPTVISISLGKFWLMTDLPRGKNKSLQSFFVEDLVPYFEQEIAKIKKVKIQNRYLIGVSMGGYNAIMIMMKHPQLFTKVVAACPALPTINHFSSPAEIEKYVKDTGADKRIVPYILKITRREFKTIEDFHRNNPFEIFNDLDQELPPIYLTVGDKDEFGIFDAVRNFSKLITLKTSELIFAPIANGGHCSMSPENIVDFLLEKKK